MSQYAYIPANRINELQLNYSIASPSTWMFEKDGVQYGGIEEVMLTSQQKAEITSLGGQWFQDGDLFQNWNNNVFDPLMKQTLSKAFGQVLIDEFNASQQGVDLTANVYQQMLDSFYYVILALQMGNLIQAKKQLAQVSTTAFAPVYTSAQRDYFINKINQYLGI